MSNPYIGWQSKVEEQMKIRLILREFSFREEMIFLGHEEKTLKPRVSHSITLKYTTTRNLGHSSERRRSCLADSGESSFSERGLSPEA